MVDWKEDPIQKYNDSSDFSLSKVDKYQVIQVYQNPKHFDRERGDRAYKMSIKFF